MGKRKRPYTIVALPDIHVPAHDSDALRSIADWMSGMHIDALVQLGDLVDHESISRFVMESPGKIAKGHLLEEWRIAREVMTILVGAARKVNQRCLYYQLEGNHETRTKHLEDRIPPLRGLLDVSKHIGVEDLRGTWVDADSRGHMLRFEWTRPGSIVPIVIDPSVRRTDLRYGCGFIHGWKHNMHNAKATVDQYPWPGAIIYGHTHTRQVFTADRWGYDKPTAYTPGWLGLPCPEYTRGRSTRWDQGFAVVLMDEGNPGAIDVHMPRIVGGDFLWP